MRVTADKSTNSLLITSSNRDYATLRLVVDKLDRPRRQVFIEAVIMDLAVSDATELGVAFHGGTTLGAADDSLPWAASGRESRRHSRPTPICCRALPRACAASTSPGTENLLGTGFSIPASAWW